MKVTLRRIGNSLGVLLPKATLEAWGLREGDALELTERGLRPPARDGFPHQALDELRRSLALAIVRRFTPREIRAQILANLHRWQRQSVWGAAYEEWRDIAKGGDDGALFAAMLARDEDAVRLRQSAPYAGLLSQEEVRELNEEADFHAVNTLAADPGVPPALLALARRGLVTPGTTADKSLYRPMPRLRRGHRSAAQLLKEERASGDHRTHAIEPQRSRAKRRKNAPH